MMAFLLSGLYECVWGYRSGNLYTAAYRETKTDVVYNAKWCTDQH